MEILEQPFLHNAGRLERYFAVLTPPSVFFFDLLLLFYFFFGFAQSTDQIACIPLDQSFQIRHLFHNLSELMKNILLTLKSKEVIFAQERKICIKNIFACFLKESVTLLNFIEVIGSTFPFFWIKLFLLMVKMY